MKKAIEKLKITYVGARDVVSSTGFAGLFLAKDGCLLLGGLLNGRLLVLSRHFLQIFRFISLDQILGTGR